MAHLISDARCEGIQVATRELAGPKIVGRNKAIAGLPDACAGCPLVTVMVCRKCKGSDKVVDFLSSETRASIKTVRCQKVCEGPVAGISIRGKMEWFGKMKGKKTLTAMAALANVSSPKKIPKQLRKRVCLERSGLRR
jgi:hypothetical protein